MKKALVVFILCMVVLGGAVLWEYVFDRQGRQEWVERFEQCLHEQEKKTDEILSHFRDSVNISDYSWEEDVIFVGFKKGKIFFWTQSIIGMEGLYERLKTQDNFVKIKNTYYEIRRSLYKDTEYFALLHIKDDYPYNNKYIKNRFGEFLHIGIENSDNIQVSRFVLEGGDEIRTQEGNILCYIHHDRYYKDRSANYILLFLYTLVFVGLFYVLNLLLKSASSLRWQLFYIVGFIVFLWGLRYFMLQYRCPSSLYRLSIFDNHIPEGGFVQSIGDLLLSAFSIVQVLYISFANIKVNFQSRRIWQWRYVVAGFLVGAAYLYMAFLNYSVSSLIEGTDVYLNMAQVVDIDVSSMIAFVAVIMGALGLLIIIDGAVHILKELFPLWRVVVMTGVGLVCFGSVMLFLDSVIDFWGCILVFGIYVLMSVNRYVVKRDVQRSVYMLTMFLLSVYVVLVCKKYEQYRELTQRLAYATDLIEERDYNFEQKLKEVNDQILDSEVIADLVANYNEEFLKMCLGNDLLDLNGYNYISEITLCQSGDSLWIEAEQKLYDCGEYFEALISEYGVRIGETGFYALTDFDGFISYIGVFSFGEVTLYLRFDSTQDSEGSGYPQLLSRKSMDGEDIIYPYSYAKYKNGELIFSSGDFTYYKTFSRFGKYKRDIEVKLKDDYTHMLIPVGERDVLVMSLRDNIFSLYYLNVLYAFLVCLLLSSYGVFFTLNHQVNFRKGTLKARIKNSIVSLIFVLFVILTALSIYLNTRSFEERHKAKAIELLKYINKEVERLDCVEYLKCPQILEVLSGLSEVLTVDINIYSSQGMLVATSRPEIFQAGFGGYLINTVALEHIGHKGAMSFVDREHIGELAYMSVYMPLVLEDGSSYILNVPYFTQNDELNLDIIIMVVIAINIAIMVMVLAFILSGVVAERVTKPLQLVNDKLKEMRVGGKNEKIDYCRRDEVGGLVRAYNSMVEKVEESVNELAKSERESAWREMARQIAHEIKNPLTPMKLNIQFMLRSLQIEDPEEFKQRFREVSGILIEQIDNMASIASAFSDFAKIPVAVREVFDVSEMLRNCGRLFEKNVERLEYDIDAGLYIFADREQMHRVFVNILKNAEQSIPQDRSGVIEISVKQEGSKVAVRIRDNGSGIPEEIRGKVFEPNFTTKTSGTGLGLAIAHRIVESMGGVIGFVTSGLGTEFFIMLEGAEGKTD